MAGTAIEIKGEELKRLTQRLRLFMRRVSKPKGGLEKVAAVIESQTKRRIKEDKAAPGGGLWKAWSLNYMFTRHANHALLENTGALYDDIASEADENSAVIFTTMIYGATHQFGDSSRNIPARPYLGLGFRDTQEVEEVFADWMRGQRL